MFSFCKTRSESDDQVIEKSSADFPLTVEQQLNCAQPADAARTPVVTPYSAGADYDYLRSMKTQVDGLWLCCCGAENELVHWTGPFPFKHLKCEKCEHVLCRSCEVTQILTPWDEKCKVNWDGNGLRMVQVCASCGLSHRAKVLKGNTAAWAPEKACYCGHSIGSQWLRYAIKSPGEYRWNPKKVAQDLKDKRRERAQTSGKHDLGQITPARRPVPTEQQHIEAPPESLWDRPGFRRQQAYDAYMNPRSSVLHTPTSLSTRTITAPVATSHARRPASPTLDIYTPPLKRSGAVRIKQGSPYIARSASYQDSPVSAQPTLISRADTWAASASYFELCEEAGNYLHVMLGTEKYNEVRSSAEYDHMIEDVIREQLLQSRPPVRQTTPYYDNVHGQSGREGAMRHDDQASTPTMYAPKPLRRAVTYNQLLENAIEGSRVSLIRVEKPEVKTVEGVGETVQNAEDWAESYRLFQMNLGNDS